MSDPAPPAKAAARGFRPGKDAALYVGTYIAGAIALIIVLAAVWEETQKGAVSSTLSGWTGTIVGFYFSQLLTLAKGRGSRQTGG